MTDHIGRAIREQLEVDFRDRIRRQLFEPPDNPMSLMSALEILRHLGYPEGGLQEDHIHISLSDPPPAGGAAPQHAGSSPAHRPPSAGGDVLDTIAEDGSLRCACGCGVTITDASPSAYYASQDCQHRAMQANATDPDEVYSGVDAHWMLHDEQEADGSVEYSVDSQFRVMVAAVDTYLEQQRWNLAALEWVGSLTPSLASELQERVIFGVSDGQVEVQIPPPPHDAYSLLHYTRRCRTCGAERPPWTVAGPVDAGHPILPGYLNPTVPPSQPGGPRIWQECGACRMPLGGRVYLGTVTGVFESSPGFRLQLEDGHSSAARTHGLNDFHLTHATTARTACTTSWKQLEARLDRFAEQWHRPEPSPTPYPAGRSPFRIDLPPPPRRRGRT